MLAAIYFSFVEELIWNTDYFEEHDQGQAVPFCALLGLDMKNKGTATMAEHIFEVVQAGVMKEAEDKAKMIDDALYGVKWPLALIAADAMRQDGIDMEQGQDADLGEIARNARKRLRCNLFVYGELDIRKKERKRGPYHVKIKLLARGKAVYYLMRKEGHKNEYYSKLADCCPEFKDLGYTEITKQMIVERLGEDVLRSRAELGKAKEEFSMRSERTEAELANLRPLYMQGQDRRNALLKDLDKLLNFVRLLSPVELPLPLYRIPVHNDS